MAPVNNGHQRASVRDRIGHTALLLHTENTFLLFLFIRLNVATSKTPKPPATRRYTYRNCDKLRHRSRVLHRDISCVLANVCGHLRCSHSRYDGLYRAFDFADHPCVSGRLQAPGRQYPSKASSPVSAAGCNSPKLLSTLDNSGTCDASNPYARTNRHLSMQLDKPSYKAGICGMRECKLHSMLNRIVALGYLCDFYLISW